jgi:hypothetical protein
MIAEQQQYVPLSIFADQPLRLSPEEYPNSEWSQQRANYEHCWAYYQGYVLNKTAGNKQLLYPVRLNIVRSAVINHAAVLLGQFDDDNVVQFGIKDNPAINKDVKQNTTRALNMLWAVNDGDDTLLEQSLYQQVFGGCFWKIAWTPTRQKWPIRIFAVDPRAAFPIWDGDDLNRLISIDVHYQVPKPTAAARYRISYRENGAGPIEPEEYVTVHEHWDEAEYFIKVDERIGQWPDGSEMAGPNPFHDPVLGTTIIPYVYTPRWRVGQGIYGEPLPPSLMGPQDEINNNLAHLNEGLADAMHQQPWVRNRPKGTQGLNKPRNEWVDLGMSQHGQHDPEAGRLPGAELNDAMIDLATEDLVRLAREHINLPDVAWGRTDASIRSALTLKYMMWPTINVGLRYRKHMATAFKWLNHHALVIAHSKRQFNQSLNGVTSLGIDAVTPQMIEAIIIGHKTMWAPMLPDDRAEKVNEIVQRISAEIISPETAIRRLDGPDELEEELNRIDEHREKIAEKQLDMMEKQAKFNPQNQGQGGDKKPSDRTNKAQAAGGRAKGSGK